MNRLKTTTILLAGLLSFSQAQEQGSEPALKQGIPTIIELFHEKPIIAIGETHGHVQLYNFLTELVQQEGFYTQVNDILIEAGNAMYQETLDAYISGKDVAFEDLQLVWMNTTQSPVDPWSSSVYFDFLKTIRSLNQRIPEEHRIRVVAADPPIRWEEVNNLEEYEKARGSRNEFYAQRAMDEVLSKGRKALLINGGAHFGHHSPRKSYVNQRIEQVYPNSVTVIAAKGTFGPGNPLNKPLQDWPLGTIAEVKGTWVGLAPGRVRRVRAAAPDPSSGGTSSPTPIARPVNAGNSPSKLTRQDYFDYLLYFGAEEIAYGPVDARIFASDSVWAEMNRRSKARFNHSLIPETRKTGELRPTSYN